MNPTEEHTRHLARQTRLADELPADFPVTVGPHGFTYEGEEHPINGSVPCALDILLNRWRVEAGVGWTQSPHGMDDHYAFLHRYRNADWYVSRPGWWEPYGVVPLATLRTLLETFWREREAWHRADAARPRCSVCGGTATLNASLGPACDSHYDELSG